MRMRKRMTAVLLMLVLVATLAVPPAEAEAAAAPKKTKITSLKSPSAGKVTVKYKKVNGAKYQIQAATNSKMTKGKKSAKVSGTTATLSLTKGKKYWVRVRTYKKVGKKTKYSKWSAVKTVTVKSSGSSTAHKHSYTTPVTEKRTVMVPVPFTEAEAEWDSVSNYNTHYYCMCNECVTYNIYYGSDSDVNKCKKALYDHMVKVNSPGWVEKEIRSRCICRGCGQDITETTGTHFCPDGSRDSWNTVATVMKTVEHRSTATTKEVVVGYKCSCGKVSYN